MMKKHRVPDWVEDEQPSLTLVASKRCIQPIAIRPIATRPSDVFYAETERAHIPFHDVHVAVQETHQWEDTWITRMRNVNPLVENDMDDAIGALFSSGDIDLERDRGARNPSPQYIDFHKAKPTTTLPYQPMNIVRDDTHVIQYPIPQPQQPLHIPRLHRPVAMRVNTVIDQEVPKEPNVWIIPSEIKKDDSTTRSLSPITASDVTSQRSSCDQPSQTIRIRDGGIMEDQHLVNVIPNDDNSEQYCVLFPPRMMIAPKPSTPELLQAREGLLYQLAITGGETDSTEFLSCLSVLENIYNTRLQSDYDKLQNNLYTVHEGTWLTLTKPTFFGCLGENDNGDPLYTLGRMTFDMFTPCNLICSIQGNFNTVHTVDDVPEGLVSQIGDDPSLLRTYHIITAFTIETSLAAYPDAPNRTIHRPIRGLLTTTGYMMSDSSDPERQDKRNTLWITGGSIEPNDTPHDVSAWKALFGCLPPRNMGGNAKLLAMKWLLGAVVDDTMDPTTGLFQYNFTKPIGGQGKAYADTLYVDSSLRIIRGHRGTVFVFSKQPDYKS